MGHCFTICCSGEEDRVSGDMNKRSLDKKSLKKLRREIDRDVSRMASRKDYGTDTDSRDGDTNSRIDNESYSDGDTNSRIGGDDFISRSISIC